MKQQHAAPRKQLLVTALLLAMASPVMAQDANADQDKPAGTATSEEAKDLDTVVVVGIRGALESAMNLKRDSQGVVDGIAAEDIGKFPDTNLAESLQRISGVSIDRTASGEGSKVTVRGIGPDHNLVLLNGRQMPGALLNGFDASNSRAFDFANLASEAVAGVEVYKTGRADNPTGGIGATINIKTARPLESGPLANLGIKTVHDTSNGNLPTSLQGKDYTGEVSGIFSRSFADGKFGIALSGSYQDRDSGYNQASVGSGWRTHFGNEGGWGVIPQGAPGVENQPGPTDLYSVPQSFGYTVNSVQRQRTNGQLTLQFAPTDRLTATLDYTYSENKIQQQRNEMSVWFNFGPSESAWTDGPAAGPVFYRELINCTDQLGPNGVYVGCADLAVGGSKGATRAVNDSVGFNVEWAVTDAFDLEFDYHNSSAEIGPDSDWGTDGSIGVAANMRGNTTVWFDGELPILEMGLNPTVGGVHPSQARPSGRRYVNGYSRSEVEQGRLDGDFKFGDYSSFKFGVASTEVRNRTALGITEYPDWGAPLGTPGDWDDAIWQIDDMAKYFGAFSNGNDPRFTSLFLTTDLERLRDAVGASGEMTTYPDEYLNNDLNTTEKTRSAYVQFNTRWETRVPVDLAVGVRYEKTKVLSAAQVVTPVAVQWNAPNELQAIMGGKSFTSLEGEYNYWLPSLDAKFELTEDMVLRASYGHSIGRPGWKDIQGGLVIGGNVRVNGGSGSAGNPNLKPLLSKNIDLSYEWYYGNASYFSLSYYRKNISNYIDNGAGSFQDTLFSLPTPIGGDYWNEAIAEGCGVADGQCIRDYIFANYDGQPGVDAANGIITGQAGDPLTVFSITTPANAGSHNLNGFEINLQHMFGDSGFGLATNYTIVRSPSLQYDNAAKGPQQVLVGLSDSANLVGFYDKGDWQVRLAYNWRDQFLSGQYDGDPGDVAKNNPVYVERYGQWDLSVGYKFNERLTLQFEGINLTDETARLSERNRNILFYGTQTGPRYMLGLRYDFQ
ncbi:TonB-dependent receptor [Thermomonas carbonis]|uniref:TonB-dependent receptor n=1 Tax=Thermomonas carbonis TaxID=1463158 RepID=A0A7G9SSL7_9GAMM|nr:TonB-dependent receptor [Thermomonas carbonis]QNN70842.1 TonB-dependent receptor [Thermomonas carbonis]GHC02786.1 TonB-dependent receptor [Thermomonas carbonis]